MDEGHFKQTNRTLYFRAVVLLLLGLAIGVLGELDLIPMLVLDNDTMYLVQVAMSLLTVCCIPWALKLMSLQRVRLQVCGNLDAYRRWAMLRMSLLFVPALTDLLLHYVLGDPSMLYLAALSALALLFVWPSLSRQESETAPVETP